MLVMDANGDPLDVSSGYTCKMWLRLVNSDNKSAVGYYWHDDVTAVFGNGYVDLSWGYNETDNLPSFAYVYGFAVSDDAFSTFSVAAYGRFNVTQIPTF